MTKDDIYELVTSLLDDFEMPTTLFDTFLNIAQMRMENMRPWMILRTEDATQTFTPGQTFTTVKDLPADFRKWYTRFSIVLADAQLNPQVYVAEIPLQKKLLYQANPNKFYCNYATNKFYLCGTTSQALTAHLYYIQKTELVSASDENEWGFPSEYHPLLGFLVSIFYKKGVDYDLVNKSQGDEQDIQAIAMIRAMEEWDSDLQNNSLQGEDYGTGVGWQGSSSGGHIPPDTL